MHTPVNHPARPVYRAIGGLIGLYLVIFGVLGVIETAGNDFFAQDDTRVLGQGTNLGFSLIAAVIGVLILVGIGLGRNLDVAINQWSAYGFLVLSLFQLAFLRTDANIFNFSVATVVVCMVLGLVLLLVGMYGKAGTDEEQRVSEEARLLL